MVAANPAPPRVPEPVHPLPPFDRLQQSEPPAYVSLT